MVIGMLNCKRKNERMPIISIYNNEPHWKLFCSIISKTLRNPAIVFHLHSLHRKIPHLSLDNTTFVHFHNALTDLQIPMQYNGASNSQEMCFATSNNYKLLNGLRIIESVHSEQ